MLLNHQQRCLTARILMLAVVFMQFLPVTHAAHDLSGHGSPSDHGEHHQAQSDNGDCDLGPLELPPQHDQGSEHDPLPKECDCLLCQMVKAPALAPDIWLGALSTTTTPYRASDAVISTTAARKLLPPARAPPAR